MNKILVPTDFSKNAATALRYAIRLAEIMKAELLVFHCAHLSPFVLSASSARPEQIAMLTKEDEAFKTQRLTLEVARAYKYLGIKKVPSGTQLLVESQPLLVNHILEVAAKHNASLIVTGTHGATGLNRFFFGSNTANLISRSKVPVLAIPEKYSFHKIRKIAFSCDLANPATELAALVPFAKALNANIDLLYLDHGTDINQDRILATEEIIRKHAYKKMKLVKHKAVLDISLIRQLKKYLSTHPHQWLVMFTRERSFWDKLLLGGKTEAMSYSLQVPLLSFKKSN